MLGQLTTASHPLPPALLLTALVVVGVIALYVFIKIEHFIFKIVGGFVGVAVVAVAVFDAPLIWNGASQRKTDDEKNHFFFARRMSRGRLVLWRTSVMVLP